MTTQVVFEGMTVEVTGLCPFCGGEWAAGYDLQTGAPCVLHSMPMCDDYERDEPDVFLKRVRTTKVASA